MFRGRMLSYTAAARAALGSAMIAMSHKKLYAHVQAHARRGAVGGLARRLMFSAGSIEAKDGGGFASVEIKILAGFVASMSLLLVGGSYVYRSDVRIADSLAWISHTQEVRASLAALDGSLTGAEVALRDYVITADYRQRDEYRRLVEDVRRDLQKLRLLTAGNPLQRENFAKLLPIVTSRLTMLADEQQAYADFGLPATRALIIQRGDANSGRDIRRLINQMSALEEHASRARQAATTAVRVITLISLLASLAIGIGFFTALFRAIHREMLARRDAEAALRASELYNRSIVDGSPDCLAVLSLDGRLKHMTPQGCRLMEVEDIASMAGVEWVSLWDETHRSAASRALEAGRSGQDARFQGICTTLKGTPKWWDVIVMPVNGADGRPERLLAVARDISVVKHSEGELLEANRFLDSLFENLPIMVAVKDAATLKYVRLNRSFERLFGCSRDDYIGKSSLELFGSEQAEIIAAADREALEFGRLVEIPEQRVQTDLGVRILHTMKMPLGVQGGKPHHLLAISVDITDRKLAEQAIHELNSALEAKAEQLTTTNRELESFSYSVSHDLRAPLRAVDGFAQMMEEDCAAQLDAEGRRYLSVIRENSRRMGALIDDLLAFSRLGRLPVVTQQIDIEALVHEVAEEALNEHAHALPCIVIGPLPPANGDRALLRQVWTNLLSNAIKYSSKAARPRIEVNGGQHGTESFYSIRDNGVGFNMDYADKLFGVFQRLHRSDEFQGTGVGLAIVHRVVTRHGGRVWAEGLVGEGAVFSFSLPHRALDG